MMTRKRFGFGGSRACAARWALGAGVLIALALPALAFARVISGPAAGGVGNAEVDIGFNVRNTHPTRVYRFEFNNIPANCAGSRPTAVSSTFPHAIGVGTDGRFHTTVKVNGGRSTYSVSGRFASQNRASGTLHVKGPVPGCGAADTGTVHWSAKHV